jgi:hypothetical protein
VFHTAAVECEGWDDWALAAQWEALRALRGEVNRALEAARTAKLIRKNEEASVQLTLRLADGDDDDEVRGAFRVGLGWIPRLRQGSFAHVLRRVWSHLALPWPDEKCVTGKRKFYLRGQRRPTASAPFVRVSRVKTRRA